ncbi:hypothetical protein [Polaribacter ponticola]|uniref:Lipoprotein n=1 Tax=Polaribacter ponticola TaxID=2978475 RepID=A0ABT5S4X4_9FLAO|nr:hypothetical protein [Polaribacter sp. MSW5]MDD7913154.1 hypothetical protein [Polaribacter sp. MSW5]
MIKNTVLKLFLIVFFISCNTDTNFTIKKITESNPIQNKQAYEFPILKGYADISKKINTTIISDLLELDVSKKHNSIFEKVWATKDNPIPSLTFLKYKINSLTNNVYSVTFNTEGCGAYCEEFSTSYNFDTSNGEKIYLDALLNQKRKKELLDLLSNQKRKTITDYIFKLKNEKTSEEDSRIINQSIELYTNCLESLPFKTLDYFDLKILNDSIILTSNRCSNHAARALDDLGDIEYQFKKAELSSFLNNFGKKY